MDTIETIDGVKDHDELEELRARLHQEESRLRCFLIGERELVEWLLMHEAPLCLWVGSRANLPKDARVRRIFHDPIRQAFVVMVWHPSFEPVPSGCEIPKTLESLDLGMMLLWKESDGRYRLEGTRIPSLLCAEPSED